MPGRRNQIPQARVGDPIFMDEAQDLMNRQLQPAQQAAPAFAPMGLRALDRDLRDLRDMQFELVEELEQQEPAEIHEEADTKMRSKALGTFIRSSRPFGIEYEINFSWDHANELRDIIGREYNIVNDGSVRAGLEVVSPILQGKAGEEQVHKACAAMKKLGADADDTCGLHVHLDASDFFQNKQEGSLSLERALVEVRSKKVGGRYVIVHSSFVSKLLKSDSERDQALASCITGERTIDMTMLQYFRTQYLATINPCAVQFMGVEEKTATLQGRFQFLYNRPRRFNPTFKSSIKPVRFKTKEDVDNFDGKPALMADWGNTIAMNPDVVPTLRVIRLPGKNEDSSFAERLKRLAAFYVAFDSVIAATLPADRRDNDYTKRADQKVSIEDLSRCNSVYDVFKAWMHLDRDETLERIGTQRHASRYCGLNFHALLKHGTIEIRYHAGTIKPEAVLHWVHLHQRIIDIAADLKDWKFNLPALQKAQMIIRSEHKADLFFKKLNLNPDTENYFRKLIEDYKEDDKDLLDELIADDKEHGPF